MAFHVMQKCWNKSGSGSTETVRVYSFKRITIVDLKLCKGIVVPCSAVLVLV